MQGNVSAAIPRTKPSPLNLPYDLPSKQEGSDWSPLPLGHLGQGTERQTNKSWAVYICRLSTEKADARGSLAQASLGCIIRQDLKGFKSKTKNKPLLEADFCQLFVRKSQSIMGALSWPILEDLGCATWEIVGWQCICHTSMQT